MLSIYISITVCILFYLKSSNWIKCESLYLWINSGCGLIYSDGFWSHIFSMASLCGFTLFSVLRPSLASDPFRSLHSSL